MKNKKPFKPFSRLFKGIYKIIDKIIVTPISTVVFKIQNKVGKDSKIEKILNQPNVLLYLSLALAITLFLIVDRNAVSFVGRDAEFLTNIPVEVKYNSSAYVIEGVPESVDVTLVGKKLEIYLAKQLGDSKVIVDLTDYQASNNPVRVKLSYNKAVKNVEYKVDPTYVTVTIKEKVSDSKTISYDLMNEDELDPKLSVKSVELSKSNVKVRGSQETIDSIATIKALIDLSNSDFTKAGTYTVDNLNLVAYSADGKIVEGVEIVATNVSAKLELNSFSKKVAVQVNTTGTLVSGKAISSIQINNIDANEFETTIYGDEEALEGIDKIPVSIDVEGQGNNGQKTLNVTISRPAGVRSIADESITVVMSFAEAKQKTITIEGIRTTNTPNGLTANLASASDAVVEVQVIGTESIINSLDASNANIYAYVDLTGMTTGTYSVPVQVQGSDSRLQYIVTKNVSIVISKPSS